jgi:uncharacterized protein YgbK (DUF1537 family)
VRTPVPSGSIARLIAAQTALPVTPRPIVPLSIDAMPEGITVVDASSDADLDRIAVSVLGLGLEHAVSGSAGLAGALARRLPSVERAGGSRTGGRSGGVLVVCGSPHATIAAQIGALSGQTGAVLRRLAIDCDSHRALDLDAAVFDLVHAGLALVLSPHLSDGDEPHRLTPAVVLNQLAAATCDLVTAAEIAALVLSGGDTAAAVCEALDVDRIEMYGQVFPGAPLGRIVGGPADGLALATKSGAHGDREGLIEIVAALSEMRRPAPGTVVP